MKSAVDAALSRIVVVDDALEGAISSSTASRASARGSLVRLSRGLYLPTPVVHELTPSALHHVRVRAAGRFGHVRQPLARSSAAVVWGAPLLHVGRARPIDALGWDERSTRTSGGVRYWATRDDELRVVTHELLRLTDLPRTLAELCLSESFDVAVTAVDWGIRVRHRGLEPVTTTDEIRKAADELGFCRGRTRLARVLDFADGRSESPGESWARVLMNRLGFEAPELQHEYRMVDGTRFRSDFYWPSVRMAGEFDGLVKYKASEFRAGKTASDIVVDEKIREDAIRASGDGVLRAVWSDLRDLGRFTAVLERAGVPRRRRGR